MGNVRFDRRGSSCCILLDVQTSTDRSMIFGFIEQILTDVDSRQIAMVRDLRKYVDHKRVNRIHEIVENQHGWSSSVENVIPWIWKSLVKVHERSISLENRLVFAVTIQNASDWHFEEQISANGVQHSQYETSFAGLCRAGHEKRGWML